MLTQSMHIDPHELFMSCSHEDNAILSRVNFANPFPSPSREKPFYGTFDLYVQLK